MKEIHIKLRRYSTAVGALLAVSATGNAAIVQGTFNSGHPELNTILDEDEDIVYIDINSDGTNDFYGYMSSYVYLSSSTRYASIHALGKGNYVENDSSTSTYLKKFELNEPVGISFDYPNHNGYIFDFSFGGGGEPSPPSALGAPFDDENDAGFVGVSIRDDDGGDHFGWIQIAIGDNSENVEFIACASESAADAPILAGNGVTVPILPIASAAGLGLVGLMAALKRRKKNNTI